MIDWDDGNWPKCGKHGVSQAEIAEVFANDPMVAPDHAHSSVEERFHAVGQTDTGRYVFIAYTRRTQHGVLLYRPVSARYMHSKEIDFYAKTRT
ncbi:MAG: BrnT family toxin [Rhizobiaceae bacterium]|nr:MAG: BrnT family toxin [Rhizobiaceae bacterium]